MKCNDIFIILVFRSSSALIDAEQGATLPVNVRLSLIKKRWH